jgi:SAM-dependent methyltransferase
MSDQGTYTYRFEPVTACVMCGSAEARTLGRRLNGHQGLRPRRAVGVATTVVQCRACGLIYANPRPVPETLAQHYDRPPEEYWQARYFEDETGYFGSNADRFRHLWDGNGVPRALDIGAGLGKAMAALERQGFDAFGIEPSAEFHDRAIANGIDPDRLQLAAVEDAEYEPNTFDFVIFGAVLEHLHDPATALARAVVWLAPGGLILIEVPSASWLLSRLLNLANRARGLDYVTNLSPMHPPYHLYEFTLDSFERHARRAAYEVVDHRFYPCDTFLPSPADAFAAHVMAATDTGMQLEVWLRQARQAQ